MRPEIQISRNTLTADLFLSLYSAVGWEAPCRAQVERALAHTWAAFTASRLRSMALSLTAGVMPVMWNQPTSRKTAFQSRSPGFARARAE